KVTLVQVASEKPKGTIVKEDPAPGDQVPQDAEVTLSVSKGPGKSGPISSNPGNPGRSGRPTANPITGLPGRGGTPTR
ncbi:MAG: PASTA domain-containing protein, partial [Frankia sp.]